MAPTPQTGARDTARCYESAEMKLSTQLATLVTLIIQQVL